jgi:hypothetical protein
MLIIDLLRYRIGAEKGHLLAMRSQGFACEGASSAAGTERAERKLNLRSIELAAIPPPYRPPTW